MTDITATEIHPDGFMYRRNGIEGFKRVWRELTVPNIIAYLESVHGCKVRISAPREYFEDGQHRIDLEFLVAYYYPYNGTFWLEYEPLIADYVLYGEW